MENRNRKWAFLWAHSFSSLSGFIRTFFSHPFFSLRLLKARLFFFFTRGFNGPLETPDKFVISSIEELISYWGLFIEGECGMAEWKEALAREPQPLILDVGANAGLFSHLIWHFRPDAELIAFEPLPKMAEKIAHWGKEKKAKLTLYNKAVSDCCGTATFYASAENDTCASLKPEGFKEIKLQVPLVTLDSVIPKKAIFLIKIDVEGCECDVLKGGKDTITRTRFLITEAHSAEALGEIKGLLGSDWESKQIGASDYLFTRGSC
jgi:FkbM family methyltransferase